MMTQDSYSKAYETGINATTRLLLSKGLRMEDAEELAQAAWVRGWEARHQLKDAQRVVPWVNSIAMNSMFNEMQRAKRQKPLDDNQIRTARPAPVVARIDAEKLLARCSTLDRSLMVHRYAGGFDMEEIANIHGMSGVATRVRIHRAKLALRRWAGEEAPAIAA